MGEWFCSRRGVYTTSTLDPRFRRPNRAREPEEVSGQATCQPTGWGCRRRPPRSSPQQPPADDHQREGLQGEGRLRHRRCPRWGGGRRGRLHVQRHLGECRVPRSDAMLRSSASRISASARSAASAAERLSALRSSSRCAVIRSLPVSPGQRRGGRGRRAVRQLRSKRDWTFGRSSATRTASTSSCGVGSGIATRSPSATKVRHAALMAEAEAKLTRSSAHPDTPRTSSPAGSPRPRGRRGRGVGRA